MKNLTSIAVILVMASLLAQCVKEDPELSPFEKVQFVIVPAAENGISPFSAGLPDETYAYVSLENAAGEIICADKPIKILSAENGYRTEAINLPAGRYTLTDFFVASKTLDDVYAVPELGSTDNKQEQTIPYSLSVAKGMSTPIVMNVFCARNHRWNSKLKAFFMNNRKYELYYNHRGDVDSIVGNEGTQVHYVYRITYTKGRIDSVGTYDHGEYVSAIKDFTYDQRGRILSYNYYFRMPDSPSYPLGSYFITYDARGLITRINSDTYEYNHQGNVIRFNSGVETYTYDNGKNPFHLVDNLYAIMMEETFMWKHCVSRNNVTSTTDGNGNTTYNTNVYDQRNRLISGAGILYYY